MKVEDFMEKNVVVIREDELASKARAIFRELGIKSLPVVDENDKLSGIITISDLIKLPTKTGFLVKDIMSKDVVFTYPNEDILDAARLMLKNRIGRLPVIDEKRNVLGILTMHNVLEAIHRHAIKEKIKFVHEIMTKNVVKVGINENINKLIEIMSTYQFGGIPVVKNEKVIGIITRSTLIRRGFIRLSLDDMPPKHVPLKKLMTTPVITIKQNETVRKALEIMVEKEIGRLPVVNEANRLVGIISRDDVAKAFV